MPGQHASPGKKRHGPLRLHSPKGIEELGVVVKHAWLRLAAAALYKNSVAKSVLTIGTSIAFKSSLLERWAE